MNDPLKLLVDRAKTESLFLACELERLAGAMGLDDAGLARELGCSEVDLLPLRLCRTPRKEAGHFRQDVEAIAGRFQLDPRRLGTLLKRARTLACLQNATRQPGEPGFLMAARDRQPDEPPERTT